MEKVYCKNCRYFGHSIISAITGDDYTPSWEICKYGQAYHDYYFERRKQFIYPYQRNRGNNCKFFEHK